MAANPVFNVSGDLFGGILTSTFIIIAVLIMAIFIIAVGLYISYIRKFNINVEIKSKRSGGRIGQENYKIVYDKGAILKDKKDNHYYFRLKNERVDLPVPPFEVLQISTKGNVLKLLQKSNEEYVFLLPDTINPSVVIMSDGSQIPISQLTLKQVEGDVSYWNVIRKRSNRKLFDTESLIMKLLPYLVPVLMFVLVIFLTWMVIKNFSVLADVARELRETATILKGQSQATIISQGILLLGINKIKWNN